MTLENKKAFLQFKIVNTGDSDLIDLLSEVADKYTQSKGKTIAGRILRGIVAVLPIETLISILLNKIKNQPKK